MKRVALLSACRTPFGSFLGAFKDTSAPVLGGHVLRAIRPPYAIDEVYMGSVLSSGMGQGPARQAAHYASIPWSVPATLINKVCGSSMKAIMMAYNDIQAGQSHCVLAGGMENLSRVPFSMLNARQGYRMGHNTLIDLLLHDGLEDAYNTSSKPSLMGELAEKTALEYGITRDDQERYVAESHRRFYEAHQDGRFQEEIIPVHLPRDISVKEDEPPARVKVEKFSALKPAFTTNGHLWQTVPQRCV
jgi:acetyl-CoA C-acetyltransferase